MAYSFTSRYIRPGTSTGADAARNMGIDVDKTLRDRAFTGNPKRAIAQYNRVRGSSSPQQAPLPPWLQDLPKPIDFSKYAASMVPWLPDALRSIWADAWVETGSPDIAWAQVRSSRQYDSFFPGNRRKDGTLRLTEQEYLSDLEAFRSELTQYGLDPRDFRGKFTKLVEGDVRPQEFRQRLAMTYSMLATNLESVRRYYAEQFGSGNFSLTALFGSAINPDLDPTVLEYRYRTAQIGGEASEAGFALRLKDATRLAERGLEQQAAREFYGYARRVLPTLGELVERHNDPDDDFDLAELTDAVIVGDPDQQTRLERLFAQERSLYSPFRLFSARGGVVSGLAQS